MGKTIRVEPIPEDQRDSGPERGANGCSTC